MRTGRPRLLIALGALVAAACLLAAAVPSAGANALRPKGTRIFFGVSDDGSVTGFNDFAAAVGKHPPLIETFTHWGNSLHKSLDRWRNAQARPVIAIGTDDSHDGHEVISPRGIALGRDDDYLLRVNSILTKNGIRAYVRPLGEPNRCLNAWAAYDCLGRKRGSRHSPKWYRRAFKRMYIILHGGGTLEEINARLADAGLPPLERHAGAEPNSIPAAPIAVIWTPLVKGAPGLRKNMPGWFFPGQSFVDWVGTDFYSQYPQWRELRRFYSRFRGKPFALTEWGIAYEDDFRFARQVFAWVKRHRRCRMLVYYQDFGDGNPYRLQAYPRTLRVVANHLSLPRFPAWAPGHPVPPPPPPGGLSG